MTAKTTGGLDNAQARYWRGGAGERWATYKSAHDRMLAPLTEYALDIADFRPGQRVLDIGCGTGATTIEIACRVAPSGSATGVDFSEPMLASAREHAAAEPDLPVAFEMADVEIHDFAPASYDVAFSRLGVMFFPDPTKAFANIRRAVAPGGRLVFVCMREFRLNTWASITVGVARDLVEMPPSPGPEDPGPYAFRDPNRVRRILGDAGWSDVAIEAHDGDACMGSDMDEAVANCLAMGPIANQILAAPEATRATIDAKLREVLPAYLTPEGVILTIAAWIVTAAA